jgi:putative membrane protein insertion efficiency factor
MKKLAQLCNWPLIAIIKIYQYLISPLIGPKCRYTPSCSHYAIEALKKYGPFKGGWFALKRISRCHPLGGHGYDPIP